MDSGPDFIGAIIKFNGQLIKGDVEIHLQVNDWFNHNHHKDAAFNDVILHAVLYRPTKPEPAATQAGKIIPILILSDFLDESLSRLQARVDDLKLEAQKEWPDVCLLSSKEQMHICHRMEYWGLKRFHQKKERFKEERSYFQFNDLFYQGLCEALGYSKNQKPFLKLALLLSLDKIWGLLSQKVGNELLLEKLQGVFFGTAGFLDMSDEERAKLPGPAQNYVSVLQSHWQQFQQQYSIASISKSEWRFLRLRPLNFPSVRLAALCQLLLSKQSNGFMEPVLATFRDLKHNPQNIFKHLQLLFVIPAYGFWLDHVHFGEAIQSSSRKQPMLIGTNKAREIVINVVLPIVMGYAEEVDDYELVSQVKQTYLSAPKLQSNELTRKMEHQLQLKTTPMDKQSLSACQQQGLIFLAKLMCPNWRCHECVHS